MKKIHQEPISIENQVKKLIEHFTSKEEKAFGVFLCPKEEERNIYEISQINKT